MRKEAPTEKDLNPFDGKPREVPPRIRRATLDGREIPAPAQEETMKVKLRNDYIVCRDGIHAESFPAGAEVDMPVHIASILIADGRAIVAGAPENKMIPGAPENKDGENLGPGRRKRRS